MFLSSDVMIIKEELPVNVTTVTFDGDGEYTFASKEDALHFITTLGYSPA